MKAVPSVWSFVGVLDPELRFSWEGGRISSDGRV